MMKKDIITTQDAPAAIGPYSQAVRAGELLFVSGQLPANPETGAMAQTVKEQAAQSLTNIKAILNEAGLGMEDIVKTTIFLTDMNHFGVVNEVYSRFFAGNYPARSTVQVAKLPKDADVEIEAIAIYSK
jgi:2-iminobutanoate/2-iminopropanoate deaminase